MFWLFFVFSALLFFLLLFLIGSAFKRKEQRSCVMVSQYDTSIRFRNIFTWIGLFSFHSVFHNNPYSSLYILTVLSARSQAGILSPWLLHGGRTSVPSPESFIIREILSFSTSDYNLVICEVAFRQIRCKFCLINLYDLISCIWQIYRLTPMAKWPADIWNCSVYSPIFKTFITQYGWTSSLLLSKWRYIY